MRTLAVTGGIGSGKSTVCSILAGKGFPVYDSDSAAKRLYREDDSLLDAVEEALGLSLRDASGAPDLRKIASAVFSSPSALAALEAVVHPAVLLDFKRWRAAKEALDGETPFCVLESAIILEKPMFLEVVDLVALVDAPPGVRLERARLRGADPEDVIRRMRAQRFDLSKVDFIIRNDGGPEDLRREVDEMLRKMFNFNGI